jgi:1,6-anhydro-N-acetylmuramate kinase
VDAKFEAILNSLPAKEPRSRLEPYSDLITEMRKRGHSYREITQVLKKACGLKVGTSTVNDFVLAHSRSKAKRSVSPSGTIETKKNRRALTGTYRNAKAHKSTGRPQKALEGIARTIKELKDRPPKTRAKKLLFEYNPDEPLRLHRNQRTKE